MASSVRKLLSQNCKVNTTTYVGECIQLAALFTPNHVLTNGLTPSSVILVPATPVFNTLVPIALFTPAASFSATLFPVNSVSTSPVLDGTGGLGGPDSLLEGVNAYFWLKTKGLTIFNTWRMYNKDPASDNKEDRECVFEDRKNNTRKIYTPKYK